MIDRRQLITLLAGAAAAPSVPWPLAARAQQPVRRIGFLIALSDKDPEAQLRVAAFRQGLRSLGWLEGRNVTIDYRWSGGSAERLREFAIELTSAKPDVVFAGNTAALIALQRATKTVPTVFVQVNDPVGGGFVASLARPGGNTTGFALFEYGIAAKWAEILKELMPGMRRIAIIYEPVTGTGGGYLPAIEGALPSGIQSMPCEVGSRADIEQAMSRIASEANAGLIVVGGPLTALHRDLIVLLAVKHRLPAISPYRYFATAGGLGSYGPDTVDQYRRAASYIDRILKGDKPADLPVQFPTSYKLVINLKAATALGLEVPPMLLARADEVIE
jgi:putative ABC transport system substrate-binding protein